MSLETEVQNLVDATNSLLNAVNTRKVDLDNAQLSASQSATQATNAYDMFDDRFLGAKSSFPTTDNDGNAIQAGALFYHTGVTPKQLYIWSGTSWDQAAFSVTGAVTSFNTRTGAVTLSSGDVTGALGFTPYSAANPSGFITSSALSSYQPLLVSGTNIKTVNSQSIVGTGNLAIDVGVTSFNTRSGAITLSSGDVTGALGFTPANTAPGLQLIAVHTFSGSLTKDIENFTSDYDDYLFIVKFTPPSNGAFSTRLKVGGVYLDTSTYRSHLSKLSSVSGSGYQYWATNSLPYITMSSVACSSAAAANNVLMIQALNVNNSAKYPKIQWQGSIDDGTNLWSLHGSADIPTAGVFGGIRFMVNDGTLINVAGTIHVYGYKKSV